MPGRGYVNSHAPEAITPLRAAVSIGATGLPWAVAMRSRPISGRWHAPHTPLVITFFKAAHEEHDEARLFAKRAAARYTGQTGTMPLAYTCLASRAASINATHAVPAMLRATYSRSIR